MAPLRHRIGPESPRSAVGSGSKVINWRVIFGGAWLKNNYPNGGPVTIKDTISVGMEVPDPSTVQLIEVHGDPAQ